MYLIIYFDPWVCKSQFILGNASFFLTIYNTLHLYFSDLKIKNGLTCFKLYIIFQKYQINVDNYRASCFNKICIKLRLIRSIMVLF